MTRARFPSGRPQIADVDWIAIRRRLANAAIRDSDAMTAEQAEAVLAQRARALAIPVEPTVDRNAHIDAVVVRIANERYAVAAEHVWRIVGTVEIAPVPGAPAILLGVMNLHGEIVPVFDPRQLLGLAAEAPGPRARVVVLGTARAELGLVVDAAEQVARLPIDQIHAAPDSLAPERRELLRGVMQDGLIVLDVAKLMADARLVVAPN